MKNTNTNTNAENLHDIREAMRAEAAPKRGARVNTCGESTEARKEREAAEAEARKEYAPHSRAIVWHIPQEFTNDFVDCVNAYYRARVRLIEHGGDMSESAYSVVQTEAHDNLNAIRAIVACGSPLNANVGEPNPRIDNTVCKPFTEEERRNPRGVLAQCLRDAFGEEYTADKDSARVAIFRAYDAQDRREKMDAEETAKRREAAKAARRENLIALLMQSGYSAAEAERIAKDAPAI